MDHHISNSKEAEFENLLAMAFEQTRRRMHEETAPRGSTKCVGLEDIEKDTTQETQHEDEL